MTKRKNDKQMNRLIKELTPDTIGELKGALPGRDNSLYIRYLRDLLTTPPSPDYSDYLIKNFENDAEKDVIEDISFTAHKGETIAFIGSTGCGKSTVINMIPRFYDATKGEVLVDGVNVKEYTQKALRNKIGYVSQKAVLFTGSIKSNVAYGDNGTKGFTDDDVKQAIETAQAKEFVDKTEGGVDAFVAQGGSNFSGGQKQRLSIARAICRHPEILIFDDSFSALDYKTDRVLRDTLRKTCADATRFIVAQRIGTIRDADKIIVLDDGKIAGMGKHNELMETCEVYRQIAYSQLSKEELA